MTAQDKNSQDNLNAKFKSVADTIRAYPAQLRQAWDEISALPIPEDYKSAKNVVFCGMGGSALGARIVDSLMIDRMRVPVEIFTEYHIPNYAFKETLVIISSYSGNTEETLSCANEAISKGAKVFGITTNGRLSELLEKDNIPRYVFDPKNNPSGQPRMAIGYSAGAVLALFAKLGFITISDEDIENTISAMNEELSEYHENAPSDKNLAKSYAQKIKGKVPILIASEHLKGAAHTIKNQLNESAKTFSALFDLPELNHHLMEGLANPAKFKDIATFIFIGSNLYSDRVQKRYPLTQEVVDKNKVSYEVFTPKSDKKLTQVFETLIFGSFVVYFLTKQLNIDPTKIPWVDHFKDKLAKS